jgi:hypothetical protein
MNLNLEFLLDAAKEIETLQQLGEVIWQSEKHHYDQKPVGIMEFVHDTYYLGTTIDQLGLKSLYPKWNEVLNDLYPSPFFSPYYEVILEVPIGSGKSSVSAVALLYEIYRLQCLKHPQLYFDLLPHTPIQFVVLSLSIKASQDTNWKVLEGFLLDSPYFQEVAEVPTKPQPGQVFEVDFKKNMFLTFASKREHVIGRATFGGILDEANASRGIQDKYNDISKRQDSRFPPSKYGAGLKPGKMFLLSSPKEDNSFLAERVNQGEKMDIPPYIIMNTPIWEIKPQKILNLCGEWFMMFTGNDFKEPLVITDPATEIDNTMVDDILEVPIEYRQDFILDPVEALREIAGIRTSAKAKLFRTKALLLPCFTLKNPFEPDILQLDFQNEADDIMSYCDQDYFRDPLFPECYRFIHIDVGTNSDRLGCASVFAREKEVKFLHKEMDVQYKYDRFFYVDFMLSIATNGDEEICIPKLINFLLWLKDIGYPIKVVSTDNYEGKVLRQYMRLHQIETAYISTDRDKEAMKLLKLLTINRQVLGVKHPLFFKEATDVEDVGKKYDHTMKGSKDLLDGVCGGLKLCAEAPYIQSARVYMEQDEQESKYADALGNILRQNHLHQGINKMNNYFNGLRGIL